MKITCDIIRDLLPLYAEDMVSSDSKRLVDEHLCGCDSCVKVLAEMKKEKPLPAEVDVQPLNNVKRMILRRRVLSVMAAVVTLLTLAAFVISFLFAPFQLTKDQALDDFYVREDGAVVVDYSSAVMGRMLFGRDDNWYLIQYSTRYNMWKGNHRKSLSETFGTDGVITEEERLRYENIDIHLGHWERPDGSYISDDPNYKPEGENYVFTSEAEKNWWYADPRGLGGDTLLHDAGKGWAESYTFSPAYPLLFFGGILAAALSVVLRRFSKKVWIREMSARLGILCASTVFSTLFVSSGRIFTSYVGIINQYWGWMIGVNTVFLTLTVLFWRQLYLLNKQDKGL